MEAKNLTVMFTDIEGFTSLTSGTSRQEITDLLTTHDRIVSTTAKKFRGQIVKNLGDGFLLAFNSPTDAVHCGIAIQDEIKVYNSQKWAIPCRIRIAINTGEVNTIGNDVFGEPVNIAARLLTVSHHGEVYLTEAVYLVMNKNELALAPVGKKAFKGIPEKIRVYKVVQLPSEVAKSKMLRALYIQAASLIPKVETGGGPKTSGGGYKFKAWHAGLVVLAVAFVMGGVSKSDIPARFSSKSEIKGTTDDKTATTAGVLKATVIGAKVTSTPTPTPTLKPTETPKPTPTPTPRHRRKN